MSQMQGIHVSRTAHTLRYNQAVGCQQDYAGESNAQSAEYIHIDLNLKKLGLWRRKK